MVKTPTTSLNRRRKLQMDKTPKMSLYHINGKNSNDEFKS